MSAEGECEQEDSWVVSPGNDNDTRSIRGKSKQLNFWFTSLVSTNPSSVKIGAICMWNLGEKFLGLNPSGECKMVSFINDI